MLVEALDPAVQADVRLGLLLPRTALVLGQLPRGNQHAAAGLVIRRGLTVRQTALVVAELMAQPDDGTRAQQVARWMEGSLPGARPGVRKGRAARHEADWIAADICTVRQVAARLEARLCATSLAALGPEVAALLAQSLTSLAPVLRALQSTMALASGKPDTGEKEAA